MRDTTLDYYDGHAAELAQRYEQVEFADFQRRLLGIFSDLDGPADAPKILEIGCGSGREAAFLLFNGLDVVATDGSKAMLDEARAAHPELAGRLRYARLPERLPFDDEQFAGVYSVATLMHLTRKGIAQSMRELHRVLRTGGLLFFSVSLERPDIDPETGYDRHGRLFTLLPCKECKRMCEEAGFDVDRFDTSTDSAGRRGLVWGNFLCRKTGAAQ